MKAGFVDNVFSMLEKRVAKLPTSERCCALLLDEVSLKRGLTYDKTVDEVNGFEDFGSGVRTGKYANQALVLMARGLQSPWKQPLAYFLACNTTPAETLKNVVTDAVCKLSAIGLVVVCVICDQGATNQQMYQPSATVSGHMVYFLYDPPHLLKSVRNNLMKHDFVVKGNPVKWKYVVDLYEADSKQVIKLAPKLTHRHKSSTVCQYACTPCCTGSEPLGCCWHIHTRSTGSNANRSSIYSSCSLLICTCLN